jgi:hypothetical protein
MLAPTNDSFFGIQIIHLATSDPSKSQYNAVRFKGWVTSFTDKFDSTWNEESVYGRMDPLSTFQNTKRTISIAFDVVSEDASSARQNLLDVNKLITFLYPVYEVHNDTRGRSANSTTLSAAPLLGMRWTNLMADAATGDYLVGYLKGVDYNPLIDQGGFINQTAEKVRTKPTTITTATSPAGSENVDTAVSTTNAKTIGGAAAKNYIPKTLNITLNFTVLHTHLPGWTKSGAEDSGLFIFGNEQTSGRYPNAFGVVDLEKSVQNLTTDENGKPEFKVGTIGDSLASTVLTK